MLGFREQNREGERGSTAPLHRRMDGRILSLSLAQLRLMVPERRERKRKLVFSVVVAAAHIPSSSLLRAPIADGPTFLPINLTLADCAQGRDGYDVEAAASHFSLLKRESLGSLPSSSF